MKERIGIFGGSFNPVHIGHCIMAEQFVHEVQLTRCTFVPTNISPFKQNNVPDIDPIHRIKMLRIVTRGSNHFSVDDVELKRKGVSYTIDTIQYFRTKHPKADIFLLIGEDQAQEFTRWKEWQTILEQVQICIAARTNSVNTTALNDIKTQLTLGTKEPVILQSPRIEISSSSIRSKIVNNVPVKYMVPEKVHRYIRKHSLYTEHL